MKKAIAILTICLTASLCLTGQDAQKSPATKPAQSEKEIAVPGTGNAPRVKASDNGSEKSGNPKKSHQFHSLDGDKNAAAYGEYYDPYSYNTPSGYINPNYRFPTREEIDMEEKVDEAMQKHIIDGCKTMQEVLKLYYPEQRDVFWEMDQVADPKTGELHPLSLDQRAVMGRNTWILWCGGNEWFWDWLATEGVGLLDFLHLVDSRQRDLRFASTGLCNQPGMAKNTEPGPWGLYLDKVVEPMTDRNGKKLDYDYPPLGDGKKAIYSDGVDPYVYGYPSGVIGLRLFPNPNFDEEAQEKWNPKAFYEDREYRSNPKLERPYRVGMSCAICHVSAHPLNPPADPAEPEWENLSATIANLYFRPSEILGSQSHPTNFLQQFLASQQPGTVDTSMTSTDWIANYNAMNPVFEFQARINRSLKNRAETQPERALDLPTIFDEGRDPRKFPRVLMDGADSVGAWASLARVYLNIGVYGEQWNNVQNTVIGFTPRRPFQLDTLHTNSVNWNVNEAFRMHYSALYFNHRLIRDGESVRLSKPQEIYDEGKTFLESSTQAMHLKNARMGNQRFEDHPLAGKHLNPGLATKGEKVFIKNCMVCHSSRQPDGYDLAFAHKAPGEAGWAKSKSADNWPLTLPYQHSDWEDFKKSPAYRDYLKGAEALIAGKSDFFTNENYLSNELRIPVSLAGTNSQRALAENALAGEVWNDFSSESYKNLPAVGKIDYFNPATGEIDSFQPKGEGRGYYRTPTLVSVWATAPLLHNNALGYYIPDHQSAHRVSVAGRLEMFDDAIGKLLWKERRGLTHSGLGGLRNSGESAWRGSDRSWIYRTDQLTSFKIEPAQIRGVVERLVNHLPSPLSAAGNTFLGFVDHPWVLPLLIALFVGWLVWKYRRWAAYLSVIVGALFLLVLYVAGLNHLLPFWGLMLGLALIAAGLISIASLKYSQSTKKGNKSAGKESEEADRKGILRRAIGSFAAPLALWILCLILFLGLIFAGRNLDGKAGPLVLGPFPKGMPVSAFMNQNPEAPVLDLLAAFRGLFRTFAELNNNPDLSDREALDFFYKHAAPGLIEISKCPDWEIDRGHYFGQHLSDQEKEQLIAFLKTL